MLVTGKVFWQFHQYNYVWDVDDQTYRVSPPMPADYGEAAHVIFDMPWESETVGTIDICRFKGTLILDPEDEHFMMVAVDTNDASPVLDAMVDPYGPDYFEAYFPEAGYNNVCKGCDGCKDTVFYADVEWVDKVGYFRCEVPAICCGYEVVSLLEMSIKSTGFDLGCGCLIPNWSDNYYYSWWTYKIMGTSVLLHRSTGSGDNSSTAFFSIKNCSLQDSLSVNPSMSSLAGSPYHGKFYNISDNILRKLEVDLSLGDLSYSEEDLWASGPWTTAEIFEEFFGEDPYEYGYCVLERVGYDRFMIGMDSGYVRVEKWRYKRWCSHPYSYLNVVYHEGGSVDYGLSLNWVSGSYPSYQFSPGYMRYLNDGNCYFYSVSGEECNVTITIYKKSDGDFSSVWDSGSNLWRPWWSDYAGKYDWKLATGVGTSIPASVPYCVVSGKLICEDYCGSGVTIFNGASYEGTASIIPRVQLKDTDAVAAVPYGVGDLKSWTPGGWGSIIDSSDRENCSGGDYIPYVPFYHDAVNSQYDVNDWWMVKFNGGTSRRLCNDADVSVIPIPLLHVDDVQVYAKENCGGGQVVKTKIHIDNQDGTGVDDVTVHFRVSSVNLGVIGDYVANTVSGILEWEGDSTCYQTDDVVTYAVQNIYKSGYVYDATTNNESQDTYTVQ